MLKLVTSSNLLHGNVSFQHVLGECLMYFVFDLAFGVVSLDPTPMS